MQKRMALTVILCFWQIVVFASPFDYKLCEYCNLIPKNHKHSESSYQKAWCDLHGGVVEFINKDKTRVDCLTETEAVEFDFTNKWAESVGQALHYAKITGKKARVVLILEKPNRQINFYKRVKELGDIYNFSVEYVTDEILNVDKNGHCKYKNCKCRKLAPLGL